MESIMEKKCNFYFEICSIHHLNAIENRFMLKGINIIHPFVCNLRHAVQCHINDQCDFHLFHRHQGHTALEQVCGLKNDSQVYVNTYAIPSIQYIIADRMSYHIFKTYDILYACGNCQDVVQTCCQHYSLQFIHSFRDLQ